MILTEEEKQIVRDMFYIPENVLFDVYYQTGSNHTLVGIDAHAQFNTPPLNLKSIIKQGKLIVVVFKETIEETYSLIESATLQEGLGN